MHHESGKRGEARRTPRADSRALICSHRPVAGRVPKVSRQNISTIHNPVTTDFAVKRTFGRRPRRLGRIFATGPLYFVTFCTHARQRFLANDEVHTAFVLFAKRAEVTYNVAVGRYVIMPDHVHLFVRGDYNFRLGHGSVR